jgi:hypothetical protein
MPRVFVESVGLFATGLPDWQTAQPVLRGEQPYLASDTLLPVPEWLPPTERRRTSNTTKLALCAGREALESVNQPIADTYTVFTSSGGSGEIANQIWESLASAERDVSPTRFHNSVHNAPAGYWGIATRNEWPSTSLCAYNASFAAGLLEAVAQALTTTQPVLLLAYDLRYPEPLNGVYPISGAFSVALLLLGTARSTAQFSIDVDIVAPSASSTPMDDAALEQFRRLNPAARSLPLLVALASHCSDLIFIESTNGAQLQIQVNVVNKCCQ